MEIDGPRKKFKGLVNGWKDTRMQPIPASEKAFDNIKVKRVGVDDLHIKMSMLLRVAHEKNSSYRLKLNVGLLVMKRMSPHSVNLSRSVHRPKIDYDDWRKNISVKQKSGSVRIPN